VVCSVHDNENWRTNQRLNDGRHRKNAYDTILLLLPFVGIFSLHDSVPTPGTLFVLGTIAKQKIGI